MKIITCDDGSIQITVHEKGRFFNILEVILWLILIPSVTYLIFNNTNLIIRDKDIIPWAITAASAAWLYISLNQLEKYLSRLRKQKLVFYSAKLTALKKYLDFDKIEGLHIENRFVYGKKMNSFIQRIFKIYNYDLCVKYHSKMIPICHGLSKEQASKLHTEVNQLIKSTVS